MPAELDRLRAVIEAMTPGPWEREHADGPPGGWVVSRAVVPDGEDVFRGASIEDERVIVALRNVAPELLAVAAVPASIASMVRAYRISHRCNGRTCDCEWCTWADAIDALDARISEAVPEETGRA